MTLIFCRFGEIFFRKGKYVWVFVCGIEVSGQRECEISWGSKCKDRTINRSAWGKAHARRRWTQTASTWNSRWTHSDLLREESLYCSLQHVGPWTGTQNHGQKAIESDHMTLNCCIFADIFFRKGKYVWVFVCSIEVSGQGEYEISWDSKCEDRTIINLWMKSLVLTWMFHIFELRVCFLIQFAWSYRFEWGFAVSLGRNWKVSDLQVRNIVCASESDDEFQSGRRELGKSSHLINLWIK